MKKIFFLILITLNIACHSDKTPEGIIPEDEFIRILTEIHIADAVLTEKGLYDRKLKDSTESYYNYILVKHNISRAKFDSSLLYYGKNTDHLNEMYDQVIALLKEKYNRVHTKESIFNIPLLALDRINEESMQEHDLKNKNLWKLKKMWHLPDDGKMNIIKFETGISPAPATYTLSAEYLVYPDDQTNGLTMVMYLYYTDGTHKTYKKSDIKKDGKWHKYELIAKTNKKKKPVKIICKLADHHGGTKKKHLEIKNVSLLRNLNQEKNIVPVKKKVKK